MNESRWPARWRTKAVDFRRYGADDLATALETCAAELEAEEREYAVEELTLEQAAAELRVTVDTVGRRLRDGEIPNAGRRGRPRIRRCDLRPTGPRTMTDHGEPDLANEILKSRA